MYSRNGKEFSNFPHIASELRLMANNASYDIVFDGEVVGDSFQQLMRQANRKHDADASDTHFYVFDVMPLREFQEGHCNMQLYKRINLLQSLYDYMDPLQYVHLVDQAMEYDLDKPEEHERMQQYAEYCVNIGFEGIMIKNMDAPYECKRNDHWLKWKPVITVDLEVTAVEAGTGRNEGRLGALVCEGIDQDREIKVNVGSGLSDSDRDSFWDSRAQVIGQVVEVQADAVTQNKDGTYSLRFPRFVRFRGFEPGEKI
jgi:DNA ligase-1